jgi:hypothetical protein
MSPRPTELPVCITACLVVQAQAVEHDGFGALGPCGIAGCADGDGRKDDVVDVGGLEAGPAAASATPLAADSPSRCHRDGYVFTGKTRATALFPVEID